MRQLRPILLLGACVVSACGGPQPPPFKPVADNKLLMQAVVDPSADIPREYETRLHDHYGYPYYWRP